MTPAPAWSPARWWWLLVALASAWFLAFPLFPGLYFTFGIVHYGPWFIDNYAVLAANDALSLGRDVYAANPLDPLQRPHGYPRLWLHLRDFGLTRADNVWLGFTLGAAFFLVAVSRLRPRGGREALWYLLSFGSTPVVLALNRANNDLVIFLLLAPVVPCLLSRSVVVRWLPVPLIALATELKFYPAVAALVLLAGFSPRETRLRLAVTVALFIVVGLDLRADFARYVGGFVPKAEGLMTFAAGNIFEAAGVPPHLVLPAALGLAGALFMMFGVCRPRIFGGWNIAAEARPAWLGFVLGSAVLTGCFLAGTNFAYRWIFALWLAPFLWRQSRDAFAPPRVRLFARVTAGLLLLVLWADPLACVAISAGLHRVPGGMLVDAANWFFLIEQPFTWAFFACLLAFLAHFAATECRAAFLATSTSPMVPRPAR